MQSNNKDNLTFNEEKAPYLQFQDCKESTCKYYDILTKTCMFENCMFHNELPKQASFSIFECQICHNPYSRSVMNDKIMICDSCLDRIKAVEKLPFNCVFCGKSQAYPSKIPLSGICDECFRKINNAIHCKQCGN